MHKELIELEGKLEALAPKDALQLLYYLLTEKAALYLLWLPKLRDFIINFSDKLEEKDNAKLIYIKLICNIDREKKIYFSDKLKISAHVDCLSTILNSKEFSQESIDAIDQLSEKEIPNYHVLVLYILFGSTVQKGEKTLALHCLKKMKRYIRSQSSPLQIFDKMILYNELKYEMIKANYKEVEVMFNTLLDLIIPEDLNELAFYYDVLVSQLGLKLHFEDLEFVKGFILEKFDMKFLSKRNSILLKQFLAWSYAQSGMGELALETIDDINLNEIDSDIEFTKSILFTLKSTFYANEGKMKDAVDAQSQALNSAIKTEKDLYVFTIISKLVELAHENKLELKNGVDIFHLYIQLSNRMNSENTQKALAEAELKYENQKLKELGILQNDFFNSITHEFQTPLTIINFKIQELLQNPNTPIVDTMNALNIQTNYLNQLMTQLLDFSKLRIGMIKPQLQSGDIAEYVNSIVNSFKIISLHKNIQIRLSMSTDKYISVFDPLILKKILNNLLSNAIKYSERDGVIFISVNIDNSKFFLEITDTGFGINEDHIDLIFNRHYQAPTIIKSENIGYGIGLSVVKELLELIDGSITVKSKPNKGTTFSISFPLEFDLVGYPVLNIETDAKMETTSHNNYRDASEYQALNANIDSIENKKLKKETMLIVEDNEEVKSFLEIFFSDDYTIISANNGKDGEKKAYKYMPDIILSDIMMPKQSGIELCKKIKSNMSTNHIPVILLTAKQSQEDEINSMANGADDYIRKPVNQYVLKARIRSVLENRMLLRKKNDDYLSNITYNKTNEIINTEAPFILLLQKTIQENITNKNLNVNALADLLNISRNTLIRKISHYTNLSPKEIITINKMSLASKLLTENNLSVKEVATNLGYSNISNFRSAFKKFHGVNPSALNKKFQGKL